MSNRCKVMTVLSADGWRMPSLHLSLQAEGARRMDGSHQLSLGPFPCHIPGSRRSESPRLSGGDERSGCWVGARKGLSPPGRCCRAAPLPSCYGRPRALRWGGPCHPALSLPSSCWVQGHLPVERGVCGMAVGLGASALRPCVLPAPIPRPPRKHRGTSHGLGPIGRGKCRQLSGFPR